jgi:hypothetical protein
VIAARDIRLCLLAAALALLAGCGAATDPVSPNASLDTTPPPAPANLTVETDEVNTLHWDASAAPDVNQYQVYVYSPDPSRDNAYVLVGEVDSEATTYVYGSSEAAHTEVFRVRAVDNAGNRSSFSAPLSLLIVPTAQSGGASDPDAVPNPIRR